MDVSVVCCTYDETMYGAFQDAADSVLNQTYPDIELIIVVDGSNSVYKRAQKDYGSKSEVAIHCNEQNQGLSASRNVGLEMASGEVVAFIDDDAVADEQWIENLVHVYENKDVVAVGGKMAPDWINNKPSYLPSEFYWIIGVTHRGFPDQPQEVRNTNGSNISFYRYILEDLDGFDESLGRQGSGQIQAEETELCIRLRRETGYRVWYEPNAIVSHKVFNYRTKPAFVFRRAFWQGYSKSVIERKFEETGNSERQFLSQLIKIFIPSRTSDLLHSPSIKEFIQLCMVFLLTITVGVGYIYGQMR